MTYVPFKEMEAKLTGKPGVTNPAGLAAFIASRKYGARAVQHAAKTKTSLRHAKPLKHDPVGRYLAKHGR